MTVRPLWTVLGSSQGLCWRSWAALGAYVGGLGLSWGLCGRSWVALGAYDGGLGLLLGPMLEVLGRSRGLGGRSWAVLGPLWAVLGRDQVEKWPWPKREGDLAIGSGPKVRQTRAGEGSSRSQEPGQTRWDRWERWDLPDRSGGPVPIFSTDI